MFHDKDRGAYLLLMAPASMLPQKVSVLLQCNRGIPGILRPLTINASTLPPSRLAWPCASALTCPHLVLSEFCQAGCLLDGNPLISLDPAAA